MKIIAILFSVLLVNSAQAETPVVACGYGDVEKVAMHDNWEVTMMPMLSSEKTYLENQVDYVWDCDEGVELLTAEIIVKDSVQSVVMNALCSKDSLGTSKVSLPLTCQDATL